MSDQEQVRVVCPACRRGYRWKPHLSGLPVRCRCGEVFNFPRAGDDPNLPATEPLPAADGDPFSLDFPAEPASPEAASPPPIPLPLA